MRLVSEGPALAPPHTGAGAFTACPYGGSPGCFAFAFVCYLFAPSLGLDSFEVDPRIAEVWPTGGVGFVLLTTVWFAGRRVARRDHRADGRSSSSVTAVAADLAPQVAVWLALTGVGQPLLMIWLYRRRLEHSGLGPGEPPRRRRPPVRRGRVLGPPRACGRLPLPLTRRAALGGAAVVGAAQHGVLLRRRRDLPGALLRSAVHARCRRARGSTASGCWSCAAVRLRHLQRPRTAPVVAADRPERVGRAHAHRPRHRLPRPHRGAGSPPR